MADDASQDFRRAIKGLLYLSETDSPFEVVHWARREPTLTAVDLRSLVGRDSDAHVEEVGLDQFFHDLTQDQDWHDADDKKTVDQYRNLLAVLKKNLVDSKVFKIGDAELEIYIIGRTTDGDWAGIKTKAVET
jgi:hypothetical protein